MADAWNVVSAVGAAGAALFAGIAWFDAKGSAKQAAASARDSANSAAEAVALQRSEVERTREIVDVTWEPNRKSREAGQLILTNTGTTTAHSVDATVIVNGDRLTVQAEAVEPGASISVDVTAQRDASERAFTERQRSLRAADMIVVGGPRWRVSARITWVSELGTPAVQVLS